MKHLSALHPVVGFLYFMGVLSVTMISSRPGIEAVSLLCGLICAIRLPDKRSMAYIFYLMLLTALLSPLFNHEGATIILWLPWGNPLTAESLFYGASAATMLGASLLWLRCFSEVISSEKLISLFGNILPSLSLVLSMTLRFVPLFAATFKKTLSMRLVGVSGFRKKLAVTVSSFGSVITWALECGPITARSMKARGYGLSGRTSYQIYRFQKRDALTLTAIIICIVIVSVSMVTGLLSWHYYPLPGGAALSEGGWLVLLAFAVLCLLPLAADIIEEIKWNSLVSKI